MPDPAQNEKAPENTPDKTPIVELKDIHLKRGKKAILNGINLKLYCNEIVAVVGPSGTGKSTMIKIISGLLPPDSGELILGSQSIGLAFQDGALFTSMSVRENLSFVLENSELVPEEKDDDERSFDERIDQALQVVGLQDSSDKLPSELSGGMQKRVGIARALVIDPEIMLYDEPSAGLDPILAHKLENDLKRINNERKMASLVVTHELPTIENFSSRVVMLYDGKIVYTGSTEDFLSTKDPYALQFRTRRESGPIEV